MTTVYAMLHHDRHTDPEIKVFHSKDAAVEYAREKAKDCCGYPEDYVEEQIADWVFYAKYSCEDDYVRVTEVELL